MTLTGILLPGLDGTGGLFHPFVKQCPSDIVVHAVAYPANRVEAFVDLARRVEASLPGAPFFIVAESFSGPVALHIAAASPPGLSAVVLVNSFMTAPVFRGCSHLPLGLLLRVRPPRWAIRRYLLDGEGDLAVEVGDAVRQVQPRVLAARMRAILALDGIECRAGCPILYLRGKQDRVVPRRCGLEIQAQHHAKIEEIDGPHLLLQTKPAQCWSEIISFLRSATAAPRGCSDMHGA